MTVAHPPTSSIYHFPIPTNLPINTGANTTLIFQTFLYSISRYVIGHVTLGWGIQPQITGSPPHRPQMKNDRRREHMSSTAPQKKKNYISTTNLVWGAAHFGHPSSCTLPITTDAPITLLYTLLTSTHFSNTNLHGRTLFGQPSSLHTFKLPVTTDAPITLSTPLTST